MDYKELINYNIEALTSIYLNEGVQINELIDNIFNDIYTELRVYKEKKFVILELNFIEETKLRMNYVYEEKCLVRVEEINNEIKTILWDRDARLKDLLYNIRSYMKNMCSEQEINKIIDTLPDELKEMIGSKYERCTSII